MQTMPASEFLGAGDGESVEYRIFGPPGTGKTTYLTKQVRQAAERFGSENVLVTSFTRAAAAELVGRDLPVPRNNVGTLHAHCYRALDNPMIAETKIGEWNNYRPQYALSGGNATLDEAAVDQTGQKDGDESFAHLQFLRARMVPRERWPEAVRAIAGEWNTWKANNGLVDFTDLLEMALRDIRLAPGNPSVLIVDEAQDFSKLQLSLIRQWGRYTEYMLVAGDDDQCIYSFTGATTDAFLQPAVPEGQKRVLRQSFRVPRAVEKMATNWIRTLTAREPKEYKPRDADGEVRRLGAERPLANGFTWKNPDAVLADAEDYIAHGKTVMFLTTCSYMLDPIKAALRAAGWPFYNPYRKQRGDWNPLGGKGKTTASRMLGFLHPREDVWGEQAREWSADELRRWVEIVKSDGLLLHGAKTAIGALSPDMPITLDVVDRLFEPGAAERMIAVLGEGTLRQSVRWLQDHILATKKKAAEYPATVLLKRGSRALLEKPKVILGTIHSVKGGEADAVYLFPDLSGAGMSEWSAGGESRDSVVRQIYVGMTRARESLILCQPATEWHVPIPRRIQ